MSTTAAPASSTIKLLSQDSCPRSCDEGGILASVQQALIAPLLRPIAPNELIKQFAIEPLPPTATTLIAHAQQVENSRRFIVNESSSGSKGDDALATMLSSDVWSLILQYVGPDLQLRLVSKSLLQATEQSSEFWRQLLQKHVKHKPVYPIDTKDYADDVSDIVMVGGEVPPEDTSLYADVGNYAIDMDRMLNVYCNHNHLPSSSHGNNNTSNNNSEINNQQHQQNAIYSPWAKEQFIKAKALKVQNLSLSKLEYSSGIIEVNMHAPYFAALPENFEEQLDSAMLSSYRCKTYEKFYKRFYLCGLVPQVLRVLIAFLVLVITCAMCLTLVTPGANGGTTIGSVEQAAPGAMPRANIYKTYLIATPLLLIALLNILIFILLWLPSYIWPLRLYRMICKPSIGYWSKWLYAFSFTRRAYHAAVALCLSAALVFAAVAAVHYKNDAAQMTLRCTIFTMGACFTLTLVPLIMIASFLKLGGRNTRVASGMSKLTIILLTVQYVTLAIPMALVTLRAWIMQLAGVEPFNLYVAGIFAIPAIIAHILLVFHGNKGTESRPMTLLGGSVQLSAGTVRISRIVVNVVWYLFLMVIAITTPIAWDFTNVNCMIPALIGAVILFNYEVVKGVFSVLDMFETKAGRVFVPELPLKTIRV